MRRKLRFSISRATWRPSGGSETLHGEDPRFASEALRWEHNDALRAAIESFTMTRTKLELRALFGGKVPFSPIYSAQEIFESFGDLDEVMGRMRDRSIPVLERLRLFVRSLAVAQNNDFGRCLVLVGARPLDLGPGSDIRPTRTSGPPRRHGSASPSLATCRFQWRRHANQTTPGHVVPMPRH